MISNGILADGTMHVDPIVAGVNTGLEQLLGAAKLEYKPNSELVELTSKDKGQYGQIVASVAVAKPSDLSVTFTRISPRALAMAMQGTNESFSQGSGSVTDEAVTAKLGKFVELSKRNISDTGFVVTSSDDVTTYVLGTDYNVNYVQGWLEILSTGSITEGQSLKVDFAYGAVTGDKVKGGTLAQFRAKLILDGVNKVDGTPMKITVWDAVLTADGAVDFLSDKMVELTMKGRPVTPAGKDSPIEVEYNQIYA